MLIETSRFGKIEVEEKDIITFPEGLIGFAASRRFIIIPHGENSPFFWLQNLEDPALAFALVDPRVFLPDYQIEVEAAEIESLSLGSIDEARVFSIAVVPPEDPTRIRINLRGPLVINAANNTAKQLVLSDRYPLQYHLFEGSDNACAHAQSR